MNAPRDHRRIVPAYLAPAGRGRPGDTTSDHEMFDRLTVLHTPAGADAADDAAGPAADVEDGVKAVGGADSEDFEADGELRAEQQRLLSLLRQGPLSLAEAAAHLRLPVSVMKVMVTDLVDAGRLAARAPVPDAELPERQIVEKVFDGLRALKSSR
jgi:hypothetical protein